MIAHPSEQDQRRSSQLTQELYLQDMDSDSQENSKTQHQQQQINDENALYLSLNYQSKPGKQSEGFSKLYDLKRKYLKNKEENGNPRRSVSQNNRVMYKTDRNSKAAISPHNPRPKKQPVTLRNNLRNILKTNYQQVSYEENPQHEQIRREFTQLQDIPVELQHLEMYQMSKLLGMGATAEVKMARHKQLDITVAIKTYDKKKMNPQSIKNLQREVEILTQLRHPNIIRLYHVVDSEKSINLILEYSSPTCLDAFMKGRPFKRINEEEGKIIFRQIVDAISQMHSEHIIHRDLKLDNILIDNNTKKVKVIDFGYSIRCNPNEKHTISCGTPSYMAPELVKKASYDSGVDIWACGIILYKILTGVFPFRAANEKDLAKKISLGKFEYPSFTSQSAKSLINNMLKLDSNDRISMQDVHHHPWMQ